MSARSGIFIAYHFPEKRWLDRVQAALEPVAGGAPIVVWDDRKLLGGYAWRSELSGVLARSKVAIMIVSDPFLQSGFTQRAKLPALLDKERERGLRICWVLASYCLFSVAGLRAEEAGHGINAALDGLSGVARDAQIAEVASKVALLLAMPDPETSTAPAASAPPEEAVATESKPKGKRKRTKKAEPQTLLPLTAEPEAPALLAPPPPRPHLEFPAPKPQTHFDPALGTVEPASAKAAEPLPDSAPEPASERAPEKSAPAPEAKPATALPAAAGAPPILVLPPKAPAPTAPAMAAITATLPPDDAEPPARRAESPMLPALDSVIDARQESIGAFRRLARWLKLAALGLVALSLPAALWVGLTHFLLIFGFALFLASLALFLHARIALLGQRLVGLRYTRSGLADELLPNRQREPLLRRAAEFLG
jgi:hypothetical protein